MKNIIKRNAKKLDPKDLTVGILGYTGATGKELTTEILKNDIFKTTILLGRRDIKFTEEFYKNGIKRITPDFEKLDENEDHFKGIDVILCCLGTTKSKSGTDGFRKVDYEYVFKAAQIAKKQGCKQFHLISSCGADKNSLFLYTRVKAEIEEAISNLGFERASIYRPKLLIANREQCRFREDVALKISKPLQIFAPKVMHCPVETLAKTMIANTIFDSGNSLEIIDNHKIFDLVDQFYQFI